MFDKTKEKLRQPVERATRIAIAAIFIATFALLLAIRR